MVRAHRSWGVPDAVTACLRVALVAALCAVAYNFSLSTLLRDLTVQTPLAYLGLVPIIALVVCLVRYLDGDDLDIHDRYLDYIVGLPLLALALAVVLFVPARYSTFFWLWRVDLISLPIFAAGAVALGLGARTLWRLKLPLLFLLLAWPPPWVFLVQHLLSGFTSETLAIVRAILQLLPVAAPVAGGDGSLFAVVHAGRSFTLSVSPVCAGANGLVAFAVVGLALMLIVRGPLGGRLLWLGTGLLLTWVLGLVRVISILLAGALWGEAFAMDVLHPLIGLVIFNLGVIVLLAVLGWFGLRPRVFKWREATTRLGVRGRAVSRAGLGLAIAAAISVVVAAADAHLHDFQLLADDLGAPRMAPLALTASFVPGWVMTHTTSYPWARLYFGSDASWQRYQFSWQSASPAELAPLSSGPITLDLISTSELESLSRYGIESCYLVHGYRVAALRRVDLGGGLIGHAISYHAVGSGDWTSIYWEWPVRTATGQHYERVVINYLQFGPSTIGAPEPRTDPLSSVALGVADASGGSSTGSLSAVQLADRDFLVGFARSLVRAASQQASAGGAPPA